MQSFLAHKPMFLSKIYTSNIHFSDIAEKILNRCVDRSLEVGDNTKIMLAGNKMYQAEVESNDRACRVTYINEFLDDTTAVDKGDWDGWSGNWAKHPQSQDPLGEGYYTIYSSTNFIS